MSRSSVAVTGRRTLQSGPRLSRDRLMPASTLLRTGNKDCSRGSGRPRESCVFLIAAREGFTVCGARPSSAINGAKEHKRCSVTGNGSTTWERLQKLLNFFIAES